jgi:hypothetical protein
LAPGLPKEREREREREKERERERAEVWRKKLHNSIQRPKRLDSTNLSSLVICNKMFLLQFSLRFNFVLAIFYFREC